MLGFSSPSPVALQVGTIKQGVKGETIEDYILLIEDREDDALLTQRALVKQGITTSIVVAKDGAEALELLFAQEDAALPCFVLIDLKLPKVSGVKVLERLRAEKTTSHLPVIVLSTSQEELQALQQRQDLSAFDYVSKAFGSEDFMRRLAIVKDYCPV